MTIRSPNRALMVAVAERVRPLLPELVFVGGHVAELLVTDPAAVRIRPTTDVDAVVQMATRTAYYRFGERLKALGFHEDRVPGAPLCRWRTADDLVFDVMPLDEEILGFANPWYGVAVATAQLYALSSDLEVRIVTGPVFLATKWAAYLGRGEDDPHTSPDLEDVVTVVTGRSTIVEEVASAPIELREWLAEHFSSFLFRDDVEDILAGILPDAWHAPAIIDGVMERLRVIGSLR
jgi:hypothetical protein